MKIIFLDIDGVFNSTKWYVSRSQRLRFKDVGRDILEFDPDAVKIFNRVIKETDAKVIVSSCWRRGSTQYLKDLFSMVGIVCDVMGETPKLSWECAHPGISIPRGTEIRCVLNKMNYPCYKWSTVTTEVETYCIIDDDGDMLLEQKDNFVQTHFDYGLTEKDAEKVVTILNK